MTSLGCVPMLVRTTLMSSPGLASIAVMLYFIVSLAVISISRGPAGLAAESDGDVSFWPQPEVTRAAMAVTKRRRVFMGRTIPQTGRKRNSKHEMGRANVRTRV